MQKKDINEAIRRLIDVYSPLEIYSIEETPNFAFVIIIEGSWQQPLKRSIAGKYALWGLESPKDIIVFTKDEFDERVKNTESVVYKAKHDGKLLYARA